MAGIWFCFRPKTHLNPAAIAYLRPFKSFAKFSSHHLLNSFPYAPFRRINFSSAASYFLLNCLGSDVRALNKGEKADKEALEEDSDIRQFLSSECGLLDSHINTLRKRYPILWKARSLKTARDAVQILREFGFTDAQLRKLVMQNPSFLSHRADKSLRPKLDLLRSLGFEGAQLGKAVCRGPRLLNAKDLSTRIQNLERFYESRENLVQAARKFPGILTCDPERAASVLAFLKESGLRDDAILRLISISPDVLWRSTDAIRAHIDYLRGLGFEDFNRTFVLAFAKTLQLGLKNLESKGRALQEIGFGDDEVKLMLRKHPLLLSRSAASLREIAQYLLQSVGLDHGELVKYPVMLKLSLENRIKPRHRVYRFLIEHGICDPRLSLAKFILLSEKSFMRTYMTNQLYGSKVLKMCSLEGIVSCCIL